MWFTNSSIFSKALNPVVLDTNDQNKSLALYFNSSSLIELLISGPSVITALIISSGLTSLEPQIAANKVIYKALFLSIV